jgi:multidrug efflux pump subunit AcrA (membrane-fusion protein)
MKMIYLDKKERVRAWFTPLRAVGVGAAAALILFVPIWPDFDHAQFVLVPYKAATLHATVPATVASVLVREGQQVEAGTEVARLRNLDIESQAAQAGQELQQATSRAMLAALRYTDFGAAEQERQHRAANNRAIESQLSELRVVSPISGVIVTPHVSDLVGRSLDEGDVLFEVSDTAELKALVYIPEFAMHEVQPGAKVRLLVDGRVAPISGVLSHVAPVSAPLDSGLITKDQLQGINPPRFYVGTVFVKNDGGLMPGMQGSAKLLAGRRSLAGLSYRFTKDFIGRKVW